MENPWYEDEAHMKTIFVRFVEGTTTTEEEEEKKSEIFTFRHTEFTHRGFTQQGFDSDIKRYRADMKRSDGFDVGVYKHLIKHLIASGFPCSNWVSRYYNPLINDNLPQSSLDTLLCLSNLAISLYNMHQSPPTYYHSVKVLKAMRFGSMRDENYNLTFQASLPAQLPVTFQTKVFTQPLSRFFEIVFVRKVKADDDDHDDDEAEIDFMGEVKNLSQQIDFTAEEQNLSYSHLSGFDDEKDTNIYSPYTDSGFKLPLPLSQLALHMFHENTDSSYSLRYELHTVNVLDTKKSLLAAQEGATYLITFEAFLPRLGKNPEIFQTKIHLSPLVPPASIKIKSVRIVPPF